MITIWILSVFFTLYGLLGLLGIQNVPARHKGKEYEKEYIKKHGIAYLLGGIPWLIACFVLSNISVSTGKKIIIFFLLGLPCVIYSIITEQHYKNM